MPPGQSDPEAVPFSELAGKFLVVEEKVDGAGVSIEFDDSLNLIVNHRGSPAIGPEFKKLHQWVDQKLTPLFNVLENKYVLFGEWMYKQHNIAYDKLPDYFLESDVYDKQYGGRWLSTAKRRELLDSANIFPVPVIDARKFESLKDMLTCLGNSCFIERDVPMEGLYIKHEERDQVLGRYKYVRYEFLKQILDSGTHVRDRQIIVNRLTGEKLWL